MDASQISYFNRSATLSRINGISTSSTRSKVEEPFYREDNLALNNIHMRSCYDTLPVDIADIINYVLRDRGSLAPSWDQLRSLETLEMGTAESNVVTYLQANIFCNPLPGDILKRSDRIPMAKYTVPDIGSRAKVSNPTPDMLYGYNRYRAFPAHQAKLHNMENEMRANTQSLMYPFLVVEVKAEGSGCSGNLWVATNQCLGGSASCVNIIERLNCRVRQCNTKGRKSISSTVFSIVTNGIDARLYVSWKHNERDYYMAKVKGFHIQEPEQYMTFRKCVQNILDWGQNERLEEIQNCLNEIPR